MMATSPISGPAEMTLRRLRVNDVELFRDIRAEARRAHPEAFGSPEEDQGGDVMVSAYRRWLSGTILGAFEGMALVGIAGFYVSADTRSRHRGHIYTVYVRPFARGHGIGDRLIRQLLALAEDQVEQVHLAVVTTAAPAIRTYARNGFEIYGTDPGVTRIGDVTHDHHLMVRKFRRQCAAAQDA